jgi:hypothetical protein
MEVAGHRARDLRAKGPAAMKHIVLKSLFLIALVCALATTARAQQVPLPTSPSQVPWAIVFSNAAYKADHL